MEIYEQGNKNKNMHIKGEKQLTDLAKSVKFITSLKFDELEKDRKDPGLLFGWMESINVAGVLQVAGDAD